MNEQEVTSYRIRIYGQEEGRDVSRMIHLFSQEKMIGSCAFYNTRQTPVSYKSGTRFYLTFPDDYYLHVVDMLRNEEPVFVKFNERTNHGYLTTEPEEVGEGE